LTVKADAGQTENKATDSNWRGRIADVADAFIPGLRLAREFYASVVRSLLDEQFPGVPYAAALQC
jgi:hypothetical protein